MAKTIGIFLHGQQGDILEASSVLRYRYKLWPDSKIVWWIEDRNRDLLAHQDIELRTFPRGFGHPGMCLEENLKLAKEGKAPEWEDWAPLVDKDNKLDPILKLYHSSLVGIDEGYFPAPHQMSPEKRHGLTYPETSQKVFGCQGKEWHPSVIWTNEERDTIGEFLNTGEEKLVFIETFAGSGQSSLTPRMVWEAIMMFTEKWGKCRFFMGSHKFLRTEEEFPLYLRGMENVHFCDKFSVRMCGLIAKNCDFMISVSSGITCAASAWGLEHPPMLQYCGSEICGTRLIANGPFEMVTADDRPLMDSQIEFFQKLEKMITEYE